ncbi:hypothetical protein [Mycobacterium sp. RTGN5]|uniref:hypothetical protein n=1 Tax=Mycobacterium sp. RTGN5 TaxID=3016522 RepID=UPI0029C8139D|nr:hypothetical protein [Mycobacterium sp. RTGN5]
MTYVGYVCGGVFALGLGAAVLAGSGSASADSTGSGSAKPAHAHSEGSPPRAVAKKQAGTRALAASTISGTQKAPARVVNLRAARPADRRANSVRTPAAESSTGSVTLADLPPSYYVDLNMQAFRDDSWNIKITGVYGTDGAVDDAEIFVLHGDGDKYVAYTRLYLNQNANVPLGASWDIKAFDPGVFPGDLGLTEIPSGPPRRLPNSAAESNREQFSTVLGFIPVVAQVVGAVNLVQDGIELLEAQRRGDIDDIADEQADLRTDLIFKILGVQQLQGAIAVVTLPATLAFAALYVVAVAQCQANPGSEICGALI